MQTNDVETMGQMAALNSLVPELERLERLLADENADQVKALESFASDESLQRLKELAEQQRSEFDALDFIGSLRLGSGSNLWRDEEFHSNLLAWLLDPRASHGIRECFLTNFLRETCAQSGVQDADWTRASVIREWRNEVDDQLGFLDVLILNEEAHALCAIENKVFSSEHGEQLTRYRKALAGSYPDFTRHHVFLTPRGALPYREEEREFWQPSTYAAVLSIVQQIVDDNSSPVKKDVRSFLRQYATTLRRNIVPDPNTNIREMVREIYLQHKEAIDLIIEYKPDLEEEVKSVFRQAIDGQDELVADMESPKIIRFRSVDWDRIPGFKTGTGWSPSDSLITFEIHFGPGHPHFQLYLGPGSNDGLRAFVHQGVSQHPQTFSDAGKKYTPAWSRLDHRGPILSADYLDVWNPDAVREQITMWMSDFISNQFPAMNEVIVNCLCDYEAETGG